MSLMDDILATDAMAFTAEFSEAVQYLNAAGDPAREIDANVLRNPPMMVLNLPDTSAPYLLVQVENSTTRGISSAELNLGRDRIQIKAKVGDTDFTTYKIHVVEKQDAGMLLLQVR